MSIKRKKCPECKGLGEHKQRKGPTFICHDCDGSGYKQKAEIIFWRYDTFPFVLAAKGFLKDSGYACLPSYGGMCVHPIKALPLKEGSEIATGLEQLKKSRSATIDVVEDGFRAKLGQIFPLALKK